MENIAPIKKNDSISLIRIVVALLLMVHSVYRVAEGDVQGFGEYLGSVGFPLGVALAWSITILAFVCSILLLMPRWVIFACIGHACILIPGIFLDHIHHGWFVVGGGTDGMEYSVLLLVCLGAVAWSYRPRKQ